MFLRVAVACCWNVRDGSRAFLRCQPLAVSACATLGSGIDACFVYQRLVQGMEHACQSFD
jgi:hypothetical protein